MIALTHASVAGCVYRCRAVVSEGGILKHIDCHVFVASEEELTTVFLRVQWLVVTDLIQFHSDFVCFALS